MTEKLKSCPFCEGEAELHISRGAHGLASKPYWIKCSKCRAVVPESETMEEVIDRWNQRIKE